MPRNSEVLYKRLFLGLSYIRYLDDCFTLQNFIIRSTHAKQVNTVIANIAVNKKREQLQPAHSFLPFQYLSAKQMVSPFLDTMRLRTSHKSTCLVCHKSSNFLTLS